MKTLALPRKYQGLIRKVMMAQTYMPFRTERYFGKGAAMSLPAGSEFSKIAEKRAE